MNFLFRWALWSFPRVFPRQENCTSIHLKFVIFSFILVNHLQFYGFRVWYLGVSIFKFVFVFFFFVAQLDIEYDKCLRASIMHVYNVFSVPPRKRSGGGESLRTDGHLPSHGWQGRSEVSVVRGREGRVSPGRAYRTHRRNRVWPGARRRHDHSSRSPGGVV